MAEQLISPDVRLELLRVYLGQQTGPSFLYIGLSAIEFTEGMQPELIEAGEIEALGYQRFQTTVGSWFLQESAGKAEALQEAIVFRNFTETRWPQVASGFVSTEPIRGNGQILGVFPLGGGPHILTPTASLTVPTILRF